MLRKKKPISIVIFANPSHSTYHLQLELKLEHQLMFYSYRTIYNLSYHKLPYLSSDDISLTRFSLLPFAHLSSLFLPLSLSPSLCPQLITVHLLLRIQRENSKLLLAPFDLPVFLVQHTLHLYLLNFRFTFLSRGGRIETESVDCLYFPFSPHYISVFVYYSDTVLIKTITHCKFH